MAIDLFCGLGGWTDGLLAEGYDVTGYDIEAHEYDGERYPARLVLADVLTLGGAQFAHADLIVASPPCTEFSYMAMPWGRGKQIARALRDEDEFPDGYKGSRTIAELTALFDACFRIQREASAAAGRRIPLVVENVRGAQPWVGHARWSFGSYYLWGDVPALMPMTLGRESVKVGGMKWHHPDDPRFVPGQGFNTLADRLVHTGTTALRDGRKNPGFRFDGSGRSFQSESVARHVDGENPSISGRRTTPGNGARFTSVEPAEARKGGGDWFGSGADCSLQRRESSKSPRRKAASARIAKIPFALSSWIARAYKPAAVMAAIP